MESGLTRFPRDSTCPVVLKNTNQEGSSLFAYEAVTLFGGPFQGPSAKAELCNFPAYFTVWPVCVLQHPWSIGPCAVTFSLGLGCSPSARRY